jgi:hypothetical protein
MAIIVPSVTYIPKVNPEIFEIPTFVSEEIQNAFTVIDDVQDQMKLYFMGSMSKITKKYNSCGWVNTGEGAVLSEKTLQVVPLQIQLEQCADVFTRTMKDQARKSGLNWNDLTGTDIETLIVNVVKKAAKDDFFRIISFANTASGDANYQMLNGLWRTLFDNVNSYCIRKIGSIGNTTLTPALVLGYFKALYNGAADVLKAIPEQDKKFYVTGSIYDAMLENYESNSTGSDVMLNNMIQGQRKLYYRGIEIIPFRAWDTIISADFGGFAPNRMIYSMPSNFILGVETMNDFNALDFWYEKKEDTNYVRMRYRAGFQFMHCDYAAVSY